MTFRRLDRARYGASVAAAAATLALTVTACGGSSSPSHSSSSASSSPSASSSSASSSSSSSSSSSATSATSASTTGSSARVSEGHSLFVSAGCGGCHTLAAAHSSGTEGPDLDQLKPSYAAVVSQVTSGGGAMPSFSGRLSTSQIQAIATFVASATK